MDTHVSRIRRFAGLTGPLIAALMVAVLAACDAGGGGSDDQSATPTTVTTPTEATSTPGATETEESPVPEETTPYLDPSLGDSSKPSGSQTTISGTVESGVEPGCLVLEYGGTIYGIYGGFDSAVVYAGAEVTLHGKVERDMMTTCQQGTPFVVEDAETAG